MKHVPFGDTGVNVSLMCLGTLMFGNRCDEPEADAILGAALDNGVNFLDTAAMYVDGLTETILGRLLRQRREQFFITTKVHRGVDATAIRGSIDESLGRLHTDHVDLYMIHWPQVGMQPYEVMGALNDVLVAGKTRFIGFCNCPAWLFARCNGIADQNGWARLVCNQLPYSLLERGIETELLPQAVAEGTAITTYRVLGAGLLAGKYHPDQTIPVDARGNNDPRIRAWLAAHGDGVAKLQTMASEMRVSPGHLATAWVYGQRGVTTPIVGVSSLSQFKSALDGFQLVLTTEQRDALSSFFELCLPEETDKKFPAVRRSFDFGSRS
jgi:aryl-alcohol dehydrogenase-like predicted oxidoreductase